MCWYLIGRKHREKGSLFSTKILKRGPKGSRLACVRDTGRIFRHGYRVNGSSGVSSIFFRAFMATLWGRARSSIRLTDRSGTGTEALRVYFHTHDREVLYKALTYFGVIGLFAVGAGLGALLTARFAEKGIWVSCGLLAVSFLIMFIHEEERS